MPDYVGFFLNAGRSVIEFETLEISHLSFSQTFYLVRNRPGGLEAKLETGEEVEFVYLPLRIRPMAERGTLDFGISVDFGDLGDIIPDEIDRVIADDAMQVRPVLRYRTYRSDDLSGPMYGPIRLEIPSISRKREGATFDAVAPFLNLSKTGEIYSTTRFTPLRGFL